MTDLLSGNLSLERFRGLVACGGFSYGDVLGAGGGWAKSILFHPELSTQFKAFFHRPDTFALGICNGCQMLSHLGSLIPGVEEWPSFVRNRSEQFEARLSLVHIEETPSIFFKDMQQSILPVAVAHGEGRVHFDNDDIARKNHSLVAIRYVDQQGNVTEKYPANPNGSPSGIAGYTSPDGRVTIMMPHPERVFRNVQLSWKPKEWTQEFSPWMQMFRNARQWMMK